ncbi:hypothetical protein Tco_1499619 [Tanacetum coccineum]
MRISEPKMEQGEENRIHNLLHQTNALMEAVIADEDAMDKEGLSAGSNQGRSTKRRRSDSAASGSAHPPPKDDVQSSKKPRESDASTTKQHPAFTSSGWQITDTRDAGADSSIKDQNPNQNILNNLHNLTLQCRMKGNDSEMEDTVNARTYPRPYEIYGSVHKWFAADEKEKKKLCKADLERGSSFQPVDLSNPEGHQILRNIYPSSSSKLKAARYLDFGLEELVPSLWVESEREYDISALGIESYQTKINLERPNWDAADYYFKEDYTIVPKPRAVVYRDRNDQRKLMRLNELHKFSDGTLTRVMEKLDHMVKDFHLFEYNKGMETRKWSEDDKRRSKDFITAIEKRLQIRRIFRSLESFVGGRIRDIDYRLINRTT